MALGLATDQSWSEIRTMSGLCVMGLYLVLTITTEAGQLQKHIQQLGHSEAEEGHPRHEMGTRAE